MTQDELILDVSFMEESFLPLLLTFDDSAQEARYGLYLRQVVQGEVFIAGCVTEEAPELHYISVVFHKFCLCACFKHFVLQRSVSQQTDAVEEREKCSVVRWKELYLWW